MRILLSFIIAIAFWGCTKDNFTTKPQLKYKSVNSKTISGTQTLEIKLDLTDQEGDFTSLLGFKKTVAGCPTSDKLDSTKFTIPADFIATKKTKGEVVITLDRINRGGNSCFAPGGGIRPDTTVFGFWTRDKAGHISDTAYSEQIIIVN